MVKMFVTGDVHIGKKYDRYSSIKDQLIKSRFDCLERCVVEAEKEHCDFFVVTGDLFDNTNRISLKDVREVARILSQFGGRVLVLPGNHDYYNGEEKVWTDFQNTLASVDHNVTLITEFKPLVFDVGDETVCFYPAFCQSKHSDSNNLGWIKDLAIENADYHIGIAHGTLDGLSPDPKNVYFKMTERELNQIPVDAWLLGHTHIPYPKGLPAEKDSYGYRIYNPGTPEQTDLSNDTPGICFVLTLDHSENGTSVAAHSYQSGAIRYYDLLLEVDGSTSLEDAVCAKTRNLPKEAVVRLTVRGRVSSEDYLEKGSIYQKAFSRFLYYEIEDSELSEIITMERIRSEFAEIGIAAKLLEALSDPKEIQMAYELIKRHQTQGSEGQ